MDPGVRRGIIAKTQALCHINHMERDRILGILRAHAPELQAAGLLHLRLFGSVARGDNTPESDVDLLVDYDETNKLNLFDVVALQDRLTDLVGAPVHLSSAHLMRPRIHTRVTLEAVRAF